jgi:hypothetical protein
VKNEMKEMDRQTELDQTYIDFLNALEDYTEQDFDKDFWETETQHSRYPTLTYQDAYTYENIWFEVIRTYDMSLVSDTDKRKTAYIEIDMVQADLDNEYPNPIAQTQDGNYDPDLTEDEWFKQAEEMEQEALDLQIKWKNTEPLTASVLNEQIEISPRVEELTCYNNITHEHHYQATNIKARIYTTLDLTQLKQFMNTRHLIYPLLK